MKEITMNNQYSDGHDGRYIEDQQPTRAAMMRAKEAEDAANQAKAEALAVEARERAKADEIARAVEWSVANNPQLQAQRLGIRTNAAVSSQQVGTIVTPEMIEGSILKIGGTMEVSYQQAQWMRESGQISEQEFSRALQASLAARGFSPASF